MSQSRRELPLVAVLAVLFVAGCGRSGGGAGDTPTIGPSQSTAEFATASASRTAATSPSPSAAPLGSTFTSPKLGYTVVLPPSVRYVGSNPADSQYHFDGEDYFSNEGVGAPLALDDRGIFISIQVMSVTGTACLDWGLRGQKIDRQANVMLDGQPETLNILTLAAGESEPGMLLNAEHQNRCFHFLLLARTAGVRDSYQMPYVTMLSTFKFGAGPASGS